MAASVMKLFVIVLSLATLSNALYEDQIGFFDWNIQSVGTLSSVSFDTISSSQEALLVTTKEGAISSLSPATGSITWRKMSGNGQSWEIKDTVGGMSLLVSSDFKQAAMWNTKKGSLVWTTEINASTKATSTDATLISFNKELFAALVTDGLISVHDREGEVLRFTPPSGYQLTRVGSIVNNKLVVSGKKTSDSTAAIFTYDLSTGKLDQTVKGSLKASKMSFSRDYLVVLGTNGKSVELFNQTSLNVSEKELSKKATCICASRYNNLISASTKNSRKIFNISSGALTQLESVSTTKGFFKPILSKSDDVSSAWITLTTDRTSVQIEVFSSASSSGKVVVLPFETQQPTFGSITKGEIRTNGAGSYDVVFQLEDLSIHFVNQKGVQWGREEALTKIEGIELVDQPTEESYTHDKYLNNIDASNDNLDHLIQNYSNRLASHLEGFNQWANDWLSVFRGQLNPLKLILSKDDSNRFGLNKILVVSTTPGNLYGISTKGLVLWKSSNIKLVGEFMGFHVLRPKTINKAKAECLVIHKDTENTDKINILSVDPFTGAIADFTPGESLSSEILHIQDVSQHFLGSANERLILFVNRNLEVTLVPDNETSRQQYQTHHQRLYFYVANSEDSLIKGYTFTSDLKAKLAWKFTISNSEETIFSTAHWEKENQETTIQPAMVVDGSDVMFKHYNPNYFALTTKVKRGSDTDLGFYIINGVSGATVFKSSQKFVSFDRPINVLMVENWALVSYGSYRDNLNELWVVEMFEPTVEKSALNLITTYFDKADDFSQYTSYSPAAPMIYQLSFVFPSFIKTLTVTKTEQGITSRNILAVLSTNQIYNLDRRTINARRPMVDGKVPREKLHEYEFPPYVPQIGFNPLNVLNYYVPLEGLSQIKAIATNLESSSLVFAYGFDMYFSRVSPEKTFDMLSDDFNYPIIFLTMIGVTIGTIVVRALSKNAVLKRKFK